MFLNNTRCHIVSVSVAELSFLLQLCISCLSIMPTCSAFVPCNTVHACMQHGHVLTLTACCCDTAHLNTIPHSVNWCADLFVCYCRCFGVQSSCAVHVLCCRHVCLSVDYCLYAVCVILCLMFGCLSEGLIFLLIYLWDFCTNQTSCLCHVLRSDCVFESPLTVGWLTHKSRIISIISLNLYYAFVSYDSLVTFW